MTDIGMHAVFLGDNDVGEALTISRPRVVEELEAIHVLKVKFQRTLGTIDLEVDVILAPRRKAVSYTHLTLPTKA